MPDYPVAAWQHLPARHPRSADQPIPQNCAHGLHTSSDGAISFALQ